MCHRDTVWRFASSIAIASVLVLSVSAQTSTSQVTAWKRVAGVSISESLASPASGPVSAVWFAAGTGELLAQTASGRIFETADFQHWRLNSADAAPQTGARVQSSGSRQYMIGSDNVYASDDG